MGRPNAAICYVPEGFSTTGSQIMGIQSASEGLLRGMACHSQADRLVAFVGRPEHGNDFDAAVRRFNPNAVTDWIPTGQVERLAPIGTLMLPGPGLSAYAWMRRRIGSAAYSLCGVTHTTATPTALDAIADLWTAPVEPWDALICTSQAVRSMVATVLEDQREYLEERFGRSPRARPQLPVIPLGVESTAFAEDPGARAAWRERLNVPPEEVVLLFMGRLNPIAKSHPMPLFLALAAASRLTSAPLHLVLAGWFSDPKMVDAYQEAASLICPDVRITVLDGRSEAVRSGVWQCADVFISPVDNIQETFGLSPLEAMAAGLPVVASDWNGYRETVRHGIDGLLVQTITPPAGSSADLARDYGAQAISYEQYVGISSQAVAVDVEAMAQAIATLADAPALRRTMGDSGRGRAQRDFDWSTIIERYQALWTELHSQRNQAAAPRPGAFPARPEPFRAFASYPSLALAPDMILSLGRTSPAMIEVFLALPIVAFAGPHLPSAEALQSVVRRVEIGPATVEDILKAGVSAAPDASWRGLGWLLKYGFLSLSRPSVSPHGGTVDAR